MADKSGDRSWSLEKLSYFLIILRTLLRIIQRQFHKCFCIPEDMIYKQNTAVYIVGFWCELSSNLLLNVGTKKIDILICTLLKRRGHEKGTLSLYTYENFDDCEM